MHIRYNPLGSFLYMCLLMYLIANTSKQLNNMYKNKQSIRAIWGKKEKTNSRTKYFNLEQVWVFYNN